MIGHIHLPSRTGMNEGSAHFIIFIYFIQGPIQRMLLPTVSLPFSSNIEKSPKGLLTDKLFKWICILARLWLILAIANTSLGFWCWCCTLTGFLFYEEKLMCVCLCSQGRCLVLGFLNRSLWISKSKKVISLAVKISTFPTPLPWVVFYILPGAHAFFILCIA